MPESACNKARIVYIIRIITKQKGLYIMTIQNIYDKFSTLTTSSDKLVYLQELETLTLMKVIKFDLNFSSIEESIMNEA